MHPAEFREYLTKMRSLKGLTQHDIAVKAGVTQAFIARLESGTAADLTLTTYNAILDALANGTPEDPEQRHKRAEKIKTELLDAGFTIKDLAAELGLKHSSVSSVISGRGRSRRVEARIHELTGVAL